MLGELTAGSVMWVLKASTKGFAAALDKSKKQVEQTAQEMTNKMEKFGKSLVDIGKKTKYIGTAALAVKGLAAALAIQHENAFATIIQGTGATGTALEGLKNDMNRVSDNNKVTQGLGEISVAIADLNTRFGVSGTRLQSMSADFLNFARVTGSDVKASIEGVADIMGMWNVDQADTLDLLDNLTYAAQASGASMDTYFTMLSENQFVFDQLNLSLPQSIDLISKIEKSGLKAEQVFDSLKQATTNLSREGLDSSAVLKKLFSDIKNGTATTEDLTFAYTLFGEKSNLAINAIKNDTLTFNGLNKSLSSYGGTLNRTAEESMTTAQKFGLTLRQVSEPLASMGLTLIAVVGPALNKLSEALKKAGDWFDRLSPLAQKSITVVITVFIALMGTLTALGKILIWVATLRTALATKTAIATAATTADTVATAANTTTRSGSIIGLVAHKAALIASAVATKMVTAAQWLLNAALTANPIGLLIMGIMLLVGAFIVLWKKSEGFRNFFIAMWEGIKGVFLGVINFMISAINTYLGTIKFMLNVGIGMINKLVEKANKIPGVAIDLIPKFSETDLRLATISDLSTNLAGAGASNKQIVLNNNTTVNTTLDGHQVGTSVSNQQSTINALNYGLKQ